MGFPKKKQPPKLLRSIHNVLEFGKHKGKTIQQVMKEDANWIHWALKEIPDFKLNRNALLLLPPFTEDKRKLHQDREDWRDVDPGLNFGDNF